MIYHHIANYIKDPKTFLSFVLVSRDVHNDCDQIKDRKKKELENHLVRLIKHFPDKPWDWEALSYNRNTTFDMVLAHPELQWNWRGLSRNQNITFDMVLAHPELPWEWYGLSHNRNITFDIVLTHLDKPWSWGGLSCNKFNRY